MDLRKANWKWQCWKFSPIWDPVILSRCCFGPIRQLKLCLENYVVILSNESEIEIMDIRNGDFLLWNDFTKFIERIDFFDLISTNSDGEWILALSNKSGRLIYFNNTCNVVEEKQFPFIKNVICKHINSSTYVIVINNKITISKISQPQLMEIVYDSLPIPDINSIAIKGDDLIFTSGRSLLKSSILKSSNECNNYEKFNQHNTQILDLVNIDDTYLMSVSIDEVKIWKKPNYNLTKLFQLNKVPSSTPNSVTKYPLLIYNNRCLILGLYCDFRIYDCITGCTIADVYEAHSTQIIDISYINYLQMLVTLSEDGTLRFWAFQINDHNNQDVNQSKQNKSPNRSSKSLSFSNYTHISKCSTSDDTYILGRSFKKLDNKIHQISCFLEFKTQCESVKGFINLECLGFLITDGSDAAILFRDREKAVSALLATYHKYNNNIQ